MLLVEFKNWGIGSMRIELRVVDAFHAWIKEC